MKKLLSVMCVVASLGMMLCFTGCGQSTPEEVADAYFREFLDINFKGMLKYAAKDEVECINEFAKEAAANPDRLKRAKEEMKGAECEVIGKAEINGDKATVKMKFTDGKGKEEERDVNLVKEDGKWKVLFLLERKINVMETVARCAARNLYVAIVCANVERQNMGIPSLWPRTEASAGSSEGDVDIADMAFKNSTEYFKVLFDMDSYGDAQKWEPYVMKDALESLKISEDNGFCDYIVAANIEDDFDDCIPILVSANVDPTSLKTSYNGKDDALIPFGSKVGRAKHVWSDKFVVVVTLGGKVLTFTPDTFTYSALYENQAFEAPGLKYLDVE